MVEMVDLCCAESFALRLVERTGVEVDAGCRGVGSEGQGLASVTRRASSGKRNVLYRRMADGV